MHRSKISVNCGNYPLEYALIRLLTEMLLGHAQQNRTVLFESRLSSIEWDARNGLQNGNKRLSFI